MSMSGETEQQVSGWTVDTLLAHNAAIDRLEEKVDKMRDRWLAERDRRYSEVAQEREKALKIKETADLAALELAREIQTYKDEKANELREQINSERGHYLSRPEYNQAHIALIDKVDAAFANLDQQLKALTGTRAQGIGLSANALVTVLTIIIAAIGLYLALRH